ncbi:MAG: CHAP domain-containing protein [Thermoactinospora sp.]|nr:CHAP domain-containing protein [Thermoactinospora sp.]
MDPISDKLFKVIEAELPYREEAGGYTKYGDWYGENIAQSGGYDSAAWCDMFLAWAASKAGVWKYTGQFAYTPSHANWFKQQGAWSTKPEPGAFVFFNFSGARISHIGIVEKVANGKIHTIEANTEGVHLKRKVRDTNSSIVGYGLPRKVKVDGVTFEEAQARAKAAGPPPPPTSEAETVPIALSRTEQPPPAGGEGALVVTGALAVTLAAAAVQPLRKRLRTQSAQGRHRARRRRWPMLAGSALAAALAAGIPAMATAEPAMAATTGAATTAAVQAAPAEPSQPYGVDVSNHDQGFDWSADNLSFGIAKVTEGLTFTDGTFARNWSELKKNGLVRGAYHFGRPGQDPVRQADRFVAEVRKHGLEQGDLLVLDLEVTDGRPAGEVNAWARRWLERVREATGVRPMFYSSWSFARTHGEGLGDYPLWVAHYGKDKGEVEAPQPWKEWALHQYASTDHDHNVARVSPERLRQLGYQAPPIG